MRILIVTAAAATLLSSQLQAEATMEIGPTFVPMDDDIEIIRLALSQMMLDPDSTIVSNVLAMSPPNQEMMTWACGDVRAKNGFGGYAQPLPFLGAIVDHPETGRVFMPVKVAERNDASIFSVIAMCDHTLTGAPLPEGEIK